MPLLNLLDSNNEPVQLNAAYALLGLTYDEVLLACLLCSIGFYFHLSFSVLTALCTTS